MIEKLKAKGIYIIVQRDESETETSSGLIVPDSIRVRPQTGKILSVGKLVQDKTIKVGDTLVYNRAAGFIFEFTEEEVLVLRESDAIATL